MEPEPTEGRPFPHAGWARLLRPEWLLAFLLASHALISQWQLAGQQACIDYYQFWVVGRAVAAGEMREIYSDTERRSVGELAFQRALAEARASAPREAQPPATQHLQVAAQRRVLETYSTPWLYSVVGLLSRADYEASQTLFERGSLVLYVAAILLLGHLLGASPLALALWLVALLSWFNPQFDDVLVGNVNRLQLFLLVLCVWIETRARSPAGRVCAGVLLGATLAFKPNLAGAVVVLLLGWTVAREFRRLLATAVGIAVGVSASVLAAGAYFHSLLPWRAWLAEIRHLAAPGSAVAGSARDGNLSLSRLLQDGIGVAIGPWLALALLAAVAAVLVARRRRREPEGGAEPTIRLLGLGAVLSLLAAEPSWEHYYVAVVPLTMVLLRPAERDGGTLPYLRVAAVLGLALVSLQNVGRLLDLHDARAAAIVLSTGALTLFLAGLVDLARWRARQDSNLWSGRWDLNPRLGAPKAPPLPAEVLPEKGAPSLPPPLRTREFRRRLARRACAVSLSRRAAISIQPHAP